MLKNLKTALFQTFPTWHQKYFLPLLHYTGDLIMMIRDKNNIFESFKKNHAEMAWIYPQVELEDKQLFLHQVTIEVS